MKDEWIGTKAYIIFGKAGKEWLRMAIKSDKDEAIRIAKSSTTPKRVATVAIIKVREFNSKD